MIASTPDALTQAVRAGLAHRFVTEPGDNRLPRPPISGKAGGERPALGRRP